MLVSCTVVVFNASLYGVMARGNHAPILGPPSYAQMLGAEATEQKHINIVHVCICHGIEKKSEEEISAGQERKRGIAR
jgi:hypothetical protein